MVQVTLLCAIVGVPRCVSAVKIDSNEVVGILKEVIKEKNAASVLCDAGELRLYLAKKDGVWLPEDDDLDKLIQTEGLFDGMEEMRASWRLGNPCLFDFGLLLEEGVVHVLVVLPPTMPVPQGGAITMGGVTFPFMQTMEVNQSMAKFWKSLREMSPKVVADAVIALPEETYILGVQKLGSVIYIRHCYLQLWKLCLDTLNHAAIANHCVVILGTPGIGKTHFGYLVLFHLAHTGATVVYETCEDKWTRTLFPGDKVVQGLWTDFNQVLAQPETFHVVDGVEPSRCDAKTILVTSPRKKIWHKYSQRNGAKVLLMPVWTEEEIYRCRDLLYSDTPVETVEKRFCKWGGVARYVLRYAKDKAKQKVLKEAIGQADLKVIVSASVESSGVECDVSHRLLHFRVTRDFGYEGFDFATNYIAEKVFHTLYQRNRIELIDFLSASHQLNDVAGFRGILFERYALSVLSQGGTFEFWRLNKERRVSVTTGDTNESQSKCFVDNAGDVTMDDRAAVERIKLRPRTTLFFKHDVKVANADSKKFLQPASRNFESVDAMANPNELLQETCAHVHPCKQKGLLKVLTLLGNPAAPRLYFVVPPDVFEGFKYQNYHTVRGEKVKVVEEKLKKLKQYVIKVDFSHEIHPAKEVVKIVSDHVRKKVMKVQAKAVRQSVRELAACKCRG